MKVMEKAREQVKSEDGVIGYAVAWWLGVPVSLLILVYLIWGR
jgi:hypothetical protein